MRRSAAADCARVVHDGLWFHLSTPADLSEAESILQARLDGRHAVNLFTMPPGVAFLDAIAEDWLQRVALIRWISRVD